MKLSTSIVVTCVGLALGGLVDLVSIDDVDQGDCDNEAGPTPGDKVPGFNSFDFCDLDNLCNGVVSIDSHDVYTMPPQLNEPLTVAATVSFTGLNVEGTRVELIMDINGLQVYKYDLCEEAAASGMPCPFVSGTLALVKNFTLPAGLPHGFHWLYGAVGTRWKTRLACIQGNIRI